MEIAASKKADTTTPASTRVRIEVRPFTVASARTTMTLPMPHRNDSASSPAPLISSRMASVPPKPAPAVTPTMPGSTSGLRNNPCKAAPETDRPKPTSTAARIRGNRTISTTLACTSVQPGLAFGTMLSKRMAATSGTVRP